jgi:transcription-repair coupling factor (superfamily II helicase)
LLYEKHRALSEVAQKRLQTIFEATELGAGFQIALRDLEIRGSGNILGAEQSGQIGAVGFDLYVRLLADAVEGLKALARGEEPPPPKLQPPIVIDLPLAAYIPESYVSDLNLRLALYQRLAAADSDGGRAPSPVQPTDVATNGSQPEADVAQPSPAVQSPTHAAAPSPTLIIEDLERDLTDRFGPPPGSVRNLLYAVHLRILARRAGIQSVAREDGTGGRAVITIRSESADLRSRLKPSEQRELERTGAVSVGHQQIRIDLEAAGDDWRDLLLDMLSRVAGASAAHLVSA